MKLHHRIIAANSIALVLYCMPCNAQTDLVEAYLFKATTTDGKTESLLLTQAETATGPRLYQKERSIKILGTKHDLKEIKSIRIEKTTVSAIELKENDKPKNTTIYNINGQAISDNTASLRSLPKGIYIRNGKKFIVK